MIKTLILSAGIGSRMRPLTNDLPKPLFPFAGPTAMDLALSKAKEISPLGIAVNVHHLADKIRSHINEFWNNERIVISYEKELLNTGGAVTKLRSWISDSHLLILNADIVSNIQLKHVINHHLNTDAYATMVILPKHHTLSTPVYTDSKRVISIGKKPVNTSNIYPCTFSGLHILAPKFIRSMPNHSITSIIDTYKSLLNEHKLISTYTHPGFWADIGTPPSLFAALKKFVDDYSTQLDQSLSITKTASRLQKECHIDKQKKSIVIKSMLDHPSMKNIQLSDYAFLCREIHVTKFCQIKHSLILQECSLKETCLNNRILTRHCHLRL